MPTVYLTITIYADGAVSILLSRILAGIALNRFVPASLPVDVLLHTVGNYSCHSIAVRFSKAIPLKNEYFEYILITGTDLKMLLFNLFYGNSEKIGSNLRFTSVTVRM